MKRLFTLILSAFLITMVMGQAPTAVVKKATVAPVIDGEIDEVWADANVYNIDQNYTGETPTLGESGTTTWQALWDDAGIYILIKVNDDIWAPLYAGINTTESWKFDHPEIYFDTNFNLQDGAGPQTDGNGLGNGHYQFAPHPIEGSVSGGESSTEGSNGATFSYNVNDPDYIVEYFVPFTKLLTAEGVEVDKSGDIGFDVTIVDNDVEPPVRHRAVWANVGTTNESWANMDDAGIITLEGAEPGIDIESLVITGDEVIDTDNGTIQFTAEVTPEDATQGYKWVLTNETGEATISTDGLLTAVRNGTVMVKALSADDFVESNEITVTISNQVLSHFEMSYIKDGDFTMGTGTTPSAVWEGDAVVEEGVLAITNPTVAEEPNPWDYTIGQELFIPESMKDLPFVLQFKAWADEEREFDIDIEHTGGEPYPRFGDSAEETAINGTSQWHLMLTTEPTLYTLEITSFTRMEAAQPQRLNLFAGMALPTVYIDSIILVTQEDYVLPARQIANSINKVYPNPVGNGKTLFVELSKVNTKVAIYNAVGQKLMEKVATGNLAKFDVSSLRQGLYFVKLSDGSVQKFVR